MRNFRAQLSISVLLFYSLTSPLFAHSPTPSSPTLRSMTNLFPHSRLQAQRERIAEQRRDFVALDTEMSQAKARSSATHPVSPPPKNPPPVKKPTPIKKPMPTQPSAPVIHDNYLAEFRDVKQAFLAAQRTSNETKQPAKPRPVKVTSKPDTSADTTIWNLRNVDLRQIITQVARQTGKKFIVDPQVHGTATLIADKSLPSPALYQVFLAMLEVSGFVAIEQGSVTKIIPNVKARYTTAKNAARSQKSHGGEFVAHVLAVNYVSANQLIPVLRPLIPNWGVMSAYTPTNQLIIAAPADTVARITDIVRRVDTASHNAIDIVPLHDAIASDLVKTIKALHRNHSTSGSPKVSVASDDHSNSVLISGPPAMRLKTKVLVTQLDSQSPTGINGNTQVVYLEYLQAKDIVPILVGVARSQFSGAVESTIGTKTISTTRAIKPVASSLDNRIRNQSPQTDPSQVSQQTAIETSGPKIEIIGEPNTNALILSAPPNIMRVLKSVIAKLDIRPAQVLVEAMIAEISESDIQNLGIEWGQVSDGRLSNSMSGILNAGFGFINKNFFHNLVGTLHFLANSNQANILSTPSLVVLDNHLAHIKVGNEVSIIRSSQPANANGTTTATPFNTFDRESVGLVLNVTPQITKNNSIRLSIAHQNNTPRNIDDTTGTQAFNISEIQTSVIVRSGDIVVLGGLTQNEYVKSDGKTPYLGDIPGVGSLLKRNQHSRTRKKLMVFLRPLILQNRQNEVYITNNKYNLLRQTQVDMMSKTAHKKNPQDYVLPQRARRLALPDPFKSTRTVKKPFGR